MGDACRLRRRPTPNPAQAWACTVAPPMPPPVHFGTLRTTRADRSRVWFREDLTPPHPSKPARAKIARRVRSPPRRLQTFRVPPRPGACVPRLGHRAPLAGRDAAPEAPRRLGLGAAQAGRPELAGRAGVGGLDQLESRLRGAPRAPPAGRGAWQARSGPGGPPAARRRPRHQPEGTRRKYFLKPACEKMRFTGRSPPRELQRSRPPIPSAWCVRARART